MAAKKNDMASIEEKTYFQMPEMFCGIWSILSFKTPDGISGTGQTEDSWHIRPQSITCGQSKTLIIKQVETRIEEKQDLHLVSFNNNNVQFAFLRSFSKPDDLLVIQYLFGEEKLRCLLTGRSDSPNTGSDEK
jgi:hypothetical protein